MHNRPFVNDRAVLDNTVTLPWLSSGKDLIDDCHANSDSDAISNISAFSIGSNGFLTPVTYDGNDISAYSVDSSGALTPSLPHPSLRA